MRVFDFNRAIVREPAQSVVNGLRLGNHAGPSFEGIAREHSAYVSALRDAGLDVTILPPLPSFPDAIFVEDPALVFAEGAILLRPGAPSRRGEVGEIDPFLRTRFSNIQYLTEGTVDGGDVLVTPDKVFIGLSSRTTASGAECLIDLLANIERKGFIVDTPPGTLHLKTASALIDEDTILITRELADYGTFSGFQTVIVPDDERGGANVVRLNDSLLVGRSYGRTRDLLDHHDVALIALDVQEIAKIDAGLSCMSLRWFSPE